MHPLEAADGVALAAEAARYLTAVDAFRREGCEPRWEAEGSRLSAPRPPRSAPRVAAHVSERRTQ
jgi:hypothetical protein